MLQILSSTLQIQNSYKKILLSSPRDALLPALENIEDQLVQSTVMALNDMIAMRENEGKTLSNDLNARLITLRKIS